MGEILHSSGLIDFQVFLKEINLYKYIKIQNNTAHTHTYMYINIYMQILYNEDVPLTPLKTMCWEKLKGILGLFFITGGLKRLY